MINLKKFLRIGFIFLIIVAWIYSGWPRIWQEPSVPPKIQEVWADTAYYDPTSDVATGWTCSGTDCGTGHYAVLDDGIRQSNTPSTSDDYISQDSNDGYTDEHSVSSVSESNINYITLWVYVSTGSDHQMNISFQNDGSEVASKTVNPGTAESWVYATWDSPSSIGTLTAEFTSTKNGAGQPQQGYVYAWYIEVDYTAAANVSVSVSDGIVAYGTMAENTSKSTLDLTDTQTATNDGDVTEDFNIKGQDATGGGCTWTLASTNGSDQYVHEFCNDTDLDCSSPPTNYTALTTSYQVLDTGIAASGTVDFQLYLTTPNPSSCYGEQSVDVTVQAVQQ